MSSLPLRSLDHLVLGVRDLDAAARFYERLGFLVGARNRHPWGTENRIVQFPGTFLELITVGEGAEPPPHRPRRFSFGAFVRAALARREGVSMAVLESHDAKADAAAFRAAGAGDFEPFSFERKGRRPDGTELRIAFTLAFARDRAAPRCGFFTCQQHAPQNFWNPAFQSHPNGATGLAAIAMLAENPTDHHIFLEAFTGQRSPQSSSLGVIAHLPRGRFELLTPRAAADLYGERSFARLAAPRFVGFAVAVKDLSALERRLVDAGIPARRVGARLVVPPAAAFGAAIAFEPAA